LILLLPCLWWIKIIKVVYYVIHKSKYNSAHTVNGNRKSWYVGWVFLAIPYCAVDWRIIRESHQRRDWTIISSCRLRLTSWSSADFGRSSCCPVSTGGAGAHEERSGHSRRVVALSPAELQTPISAIKRTASFANDSSNRMICLRWMLRSPSCGDICRRTEFKSLPGFSLALFYVSDTMNSMTNIAGIHHNQVLNTASITACFRMS